MPGDIAVPVRLPCLPFEIAELRFELLDHIVHPLQIVFGRIEPELGFMSPGVQPGNPGGLFQKMPSFLRLGVDQCPDAALADNCGGMSAGRQIGK